MLAGASVIGGLNRYGITADNAVALVAAVYTVFTVAALYTDDRFVRHRTWLERTLLWLGAHAPLIRLALIAVAAVVVGLTFIFAPALLPVLLLAAAKGAVTGFAAGALAGALTGGGWQDVLAGAARGALTGAAMAVAVVGVAGIIGTIKAQKTANAAWHAHAGEVQRASAVRTMEQNQLNLLVDTTYSLQVQQKMWQDKMHNFPREVENFGALGKITVKSGSDNNIYTFVDIKGSYLGRDGVFEFIINKDKVMTHRFFNPWR